MIDYSFAQYLELLAQRSAERLLPGLKTEYLPESYTFKTQASLEKLEEIILANGLVLKTDLEVIRTYQDESGLIQGFIPFPEMTSYRKILIVNQYKEFEFKEFEYNADMVAVVPAIDYNSSFRYRTEGRKDTGELEAVAKVTEGIMQALFTEHIPAFWKMEGAQQLPVVVGNLPSGSRNRFTLSS